MPKGKSRQNAKNKTVSKAARLDSTPDTTRNGIIRENRARKIDVHWGAMESGRDPSWSLVARIRVIRWSLVAHTNS